MKHYFTSSISALFEKQYMWEILKNNKRQIQKHHEL